MEIQHNLLWTVFVAIWKTTLPGVPSFEKRFAKDLFGDPYSTEAGFSVAEGYVIEQTGTDPGPKVVVGPQRLQVHLRTLDSLAATLDALMGELRGQPWADETTWNLGAMGFNSDNEWIAEGREIRAELTERFIMPGLGPTAALGEGTDVAAVGIRLALQTPRQVYKIAVEPRAGRNDGLFANINDHRDVECPMPSGDEAAALFEESIRDIKTVLGPMLVGKGPDK